MGHKGRNAKEDRLSLLHHLLHEVHKENPKTMKREDRMEKEKEKNRKAKNDERVGEEDCHEIVQRDEREERAQGQSPS